MINNNTHAKDSPWFNDRICPDKKPTYKIIARSMSLNGDSIVMLHKAGNEIVENYYIRELVNNDVIMSLLDKKEADLLQWVVKSEITDPLNEC